MACGLENVLNTMPEEARRKKRTSAIEYNLLKGKADTLREEFLREIEDKEEREGKRKEIECIKKGALLEEMSETEDGRSTI